MYYRAGTKGYCGECGELMFVFSMDAKTRLERVSEAMFEKNMGQGPWVNGEMMSCRCCKTPWGFPFFNAMLNQELKPVRFEPPVSNSNY